MKILYLTHFETIGGRRHLEIETLLKEGHAVRVVAWNVSGKEYRYKFPVTFIHNKSRVYFSQSLKQGLFLTLRRIIGGLYPRTFKEVMVTPWDVVHCGNLALLPLAVMGRCLKGGKVIYDSYEMPILKIPGRLKNRKLAFLVRLFLEKIERLLLLGVDAVLTIPSMHNAEKNKLAQYCQNVEVLLNVPKLAGIVDEKTFPQPPSAIYIGGLTREKGLYAMLAATALLTKTHRDFKLILVGQMIENAAEVAQEIDRLGIRDNVVIHAWVPPDELGKFLSEAWIGLWPSQPSEQFSRVTTGNSRKGFQYMKCGLPVVGTSFGEIAKVVAEEEAGLLVDATQPEAIAAAINEIIGNGEMRQKMSANGIAAVRNKYNWESESKKLMRVYADLKG